MNKRTFDTKKLWNKPKTTLTKRGEKSQIVQKFHNNPAKVQKIFSQDINQKETKNPSQSKFDPRISTNKNQTKQQNQSSFGEGLKANFEFVQRLYNFKDKINANFNDKWNYNKFSKSFDFQDFKTNFKTKFNQLIMTTLVSSLIMFFAYLAFFDEHFIVRSYTVKFDESSYMNQFQVKKLVDHFHTKKLYGILPNNQYFFLNSINLTASAKQIFPEIKEVELTNRIWPDKAIVQVKLTKTAVTLGVRENNQTKYWRVANTGKVLTEDKAGIWQNLVIVDRPYSLINQNTNEPNSRISLQNRSFETEQFQLKRFELTQQLWQMFKDKNINITSTTYPSLIDTDIIFKTENQTKLLIDSGAFASNHQQKRILEFLEASNNGIKIKDHEKQGKFNYIDFRIPNKIFYCRNDQKCSNN